MSETWDPGKAISKRSYQRIVSEAVSKAISRSEGMLDARTSIEYVDIVQAIADTGFLRSAIDKGLKHGDPKVRDLIGQFLLDLGLTNVAPPRPAPAAEAEPRLPEPPPPAEPREIPVLPPVEARELPAPPPVEPKREPDEESRTRTLMAVNQPPEPSPAPVRPAPVLSAPTSGRKKIDDLTAEDFGITDAAKFEEWQDAVRSARKNGNVMGIVTVGVIVLVVLSTGVLLLPGALPIFLGYWLINRKANALAKELGITPRALRAALKGKPVVPVSAPRPSQPAPAALQCPHCRAGYDLRDYSPEATVWKCSSCHGELPKEPAS